MPKKKVNKSLPSYMPTQYEQEAYMWGIDNGCIISPIGIKDNFNEWKIGISSHYKHKEIRLSPKSYGRDEIWQKVYEFYIFYYEKRKT